MYQLSVLLPSAYAEKRHRFIQNLKETVSDFKSIEVVVCLDGYEKPRRDQDDENILYCYSPPSKFRGSFFNACWRNSTGRYLMMANDDILINTKNWDKLIPYDKYPDDIALFYFKDSQFNEFFSCHPIWSRRVMNIDPNLFEPSYQITKCDNTIWDVHPSSRRFYIPEIVIDHIQTPYDLSKWQGAYDDDNRLYIETLSQRVAVKNKLLDELGISENKVLIGVATAEMGRRADFYDHFNMIERPPNSMNMAIHGQSIAHNRNKIVEQALAHKCSHVFFLDDDVICRPSILIDLLKHDMDIVCGLQLHRNFPHFPLIYGDRIDTRFKLLQLPNLKSGLIKISAAGLGCCLIKTEVFNRLEPPWFRLGELKPDQLTEDTGFFHRVLNAKIDSYCDLDSPVGHIMTAVVSPIRKDNTWTVDYRTGGSGTIAFVPQLVEEKKNVN